MGRITVYLPDEVEETLVEMAEKHELSKGRLATFAVRYMLYMSQSGEFDISDYMKTITILDFPEDD